MRRKAIFPLGGKALGAFLICFLILALKVEASASDLLFSEIMYDLEGSDSGHEWVELYNSGTEEVIATSTWRFFDGANHNLSLHQGSSTIASQEFFVLADNAVNFLADYPSYNGTIFDTVLSLPNTSSTIALSFDSGASQAIQANYDSSWGGAGNDKTLEKIILNQDSSSSNWQESGISGGTPGMINSDGQDQDPPADDLPPEEEIETNYWSQIIISEFLPNPIGTDDNEWIEIYNQGPELVDLSGFGLSDNTERIFILSAEDFSNINLSAGEYLVVYKNISGISLNNSSGDAVELYDPNGNLLESVNYSGSALEDRSYSRENNSFYWSKTLTPGRANQLSYNQKPVAQISVIADSFFPSDKINFSAENSSDAENNDLDFQWNFGDGETSVKEQIKHSYKNPGTYQVILRVTDSEGAYSEANYNLVINLAKTSSDEEETELKSKTSSLTPLDIEEDDLIISEFIPNPIGSDDSEWIELYNASNKKINLSGWQLDDADGGSKPYISSTSTIEANSFLLLNKKDTKLSLNNSNDSVRLLTPASELWQEISYEKIPEGQSYAWDFSNQEWFVADPSPGKTNLFIKDLENIETKIAEIETEIVYAVYEIKDLEKNNLVSVQGVLLNKPNEKTRSLYLADGNADLIDFSQIVEVYSYYKDFPDLDAGDLVTVTGEISKIDELPRLKIKSAEQIVNSGLNFSIKNPEAVEVNNIDSDFVGQFITAQGIVVKKSGKNIYLAGDLEEEAQVRVYADFPLTDVEIKKGIEMIVRGILTTSESGFKLLPFTLSDILVSREVLGEKIANDTAENIELVSSTNEVLSSQRKNNIQKILLFSLAGLVLVFISYFIRKKYRS